MPHQSPRIDPLQSDDFILFQILAQRILIPPVARVFAILLDDKPGGVDLPRLPILSVRSDITDQRIRHRNNLFAVRWIGNYLLIAAHTRIEYDLAAPNPQRSERAAPKHRAIFQ